MLILRYNMFYGKQWKSVMLKSLVVEYVRLSYFVPSYFYRICSWLNQVLWKKKKKIKVFILVQPFNSAWMARQFQSNNNVQKIVKDKETFVSKISSILKMEVKWQLIHVGNLKRTSCCQYHKRRSWYGFWS